MKLLIRGTTMDPYTCGTQVINAQTGEVLEDVISVQWKHEANKQPVAIIEVRGVLIDRNLSRIEGGQLSSRPLTT